jgi:tetratricopeptide (TPR) repeat protein
MNSSADTFALALERRRSRELPEAERLLRQVIQADASHAEAWRELGLTCLEMGKLSDAEETLRQAVRLAPGNAAAHSDLGIALARQKKLNQAEQSFREALRLQPDMSPAYNNLGLTLMWQNRLEEAITSIRRAIELTPTLADAHNNLGLALAARGQTTDAVECYRRALQFDPNHQNAQTNLNRALGQSAQRPPGSPWTSPPSNADRQAEAYNEQAVQYFHEGRLQDAIAAFQQAIRVQPNHADAHGNLGNIYYYQGRHDEAVASYRRAIALNPTSGLFHSNLGNVLAEQKKFEEAETVCREAVRLQSADPGSHNNLGNALKGQGKLDEAVASYHQALRLEPNSPDTYYNLGLVLAEQNKHGDAVVSYREAIRLKPDYVDAIAALAAALVDQKQLDEGIAVARQALQLSPDCALARWALGVGHMEKDEPLMALGCFEEAARLKPDFVDAHWARGAALMAQNRARDAIPALDAALRLEPAHPNSHFGRGLAYLLLGDLGTGFSEYEWRSKCKEAGSGAIPGPVWDGSPLGGRTILLHAEQGLGDTIHFVRYASLVKKRGGTVIVQCQPALTRLLARAAGIDRIIAQGSPLPDYDVHASLLSLPSILRTTSATVPADVPYVTADERLVERWRQELDALPGFRVGISWQGSREHERDRFRSIPLHEFAPLAEVEGVRFLSLQKGYGSDQLREIAGRFPVIDWTDRLDEAAGPFMDTAALMKSLDLIITSDTANAHLAGALGVPVWVVLSFNPDWRWQLDREDSPWYPTMRLFRPRARTGWQEVIQRVASELQKRV